MMGSPSLALTNRAGVLTLRELLRSVAISMRPAQWVKNGLLFAGLIFGGKLFDVSAVKAAIGAAVVFCLLSSGFYLVNDVRDAEVDRLHPLKRVRPIAAGALAPQRALQIGIATIAAGIVGS